MDARSLKTAGAALATGGGAALVGATLTYMFLEGPGVWNGFLTVMGGTCGIFGSCTWPTLVAIGAAADGEATADQRWRVWAAQQQERTAPPLPGDIDGQVAELGANLSALGHSTATLIDQVRGIRRSMEGLAGKVAADDAELIVLRQRAEDGRRAAAILAGAAGPLGPMAFAPRAARLADAQRPDPRPAPAVPRRAGNGERGGEAGLQAVGFELAGSSDGHQAAERHGAQANDRPGPRREAERENGAHPANRSPDDRDGGQDQHRLGERPEQANVTAVVLNVANPPFVPRSDE